MASDVDADDDGGAMVAKSLFLGGATPWAPVAGPLQDAPSVKSSPWLAPGYGLLASHICRRIGRVLLIREVVIKEEPRRHK